MKRRSANRRAVWAALRAHPDGATVSTIARTSGVTEPAVYLRGWVAAGIVAIDNGPPPARWYRLVRDSGHHPPGPEPHAAAIWRAICVHRQFQTRDILMATGAARATVTGYLWRLTRGGYLRTAGRPITYRLARHTGPLHPEVSADGSIYDQNLARVTYRPAP